MPAPSYDVRGEVENQKGYRYTEDLQRPGKTCPPTNTQAAHTADCISWHMCMYINVMVLRHHQQTQRREQGHQIMIRDHHTSK
mmetsp:Transcript_9199/g.14099  ORF Transcript_9199/g.14099 Transcript_9199/m.14099 type:complete len:83 (+) Transcript_9199:95-343(+)